MEKPTLKSILSKSKKQTHRSVEELDERFVVKIVFVFRQTKTTNESICSSVSYYVMDGSSKRVTFDDDEQQNNLSLIEETVPIVDEDKEEQSEDEEETVCRMKQTIFRC